MKTVGVTGGAGFIGSNLVSRLLRGGYEVVVVDDLSTGLLSNLEGMKCDIRNISITDMSEVENALSNCQTIFHLAARGSVPRSIKNPISTHEVNATGTLNVLEIASKTGAHLIFSSSSSVYGRNKQLPKDELMWLGPMSPYAASKLSAESYVQAYSATYQVPTTLLRFFNIFGPHQRPEHEYAAVIPKWIWLAMQGKSLDLFGDGTVTRDFTYIDTVIDVLMTAFEERVVSDGPVNLAYGNKISLNEILELLRSQFPGIIVNQLNDRLGDVRDSQNSPKLISEMFPKVIPKPFEDGFFETVKWMKKFGPGFTDNSRALN
jgi:UDP-glucose 4-epimerase